MHMQLNEAPDQPIHKHNLIMAFSLSAYRLIGYCKYRNWRLQKYIDEQEYPRCEERSAQSDLSLRYSHLT